MVGLDAALGTSQEEENCLAEGGAASAEILLRFLGRCFLSELDEGLLDEVLDGGLLEEVPYAAADALVQAGQAQVARWRTGVLEAEASAVRGGDEAQEARRRTAVDLASAWFGCFGGPARPAAPPWASVYLDREGLLFADETIAVRRLYHAYGLAVESEGAEPDDHIGLMLGFLAHLAGLEAGEADPKKLAALRVDQTDFIGRHLLPFMGTWVDDVVAKGGSDFYAGVARIALGAVRVRAAELGEG